MTNRIRSTSAALLFLGCLVTLTSAFNLPSRSPDLPPQSASLSAVAKPAQQRTTLTLADRVAYQRTIEEVYWRHRIWPKELPLESGRAESQLPKVMAAVSAKYRLPTISDGANGCTDDTWTTTSTTNTPTGRFYHTAVWTGSEMIVWGGYNGTDLDTGGRYNPSTDSWTAMSTTNAPAGRFFHTAVWTGTEMIVWGGTPDASNGLNTGGRYNPSTDTWTATSTTNAPAARYLHTAVWSGTEMIIWGGNDGTNNLNTGGRYNPGTDSWIATSTTNAPAARWQHTAAWTGSEMIIWGGNDGSNSLNTGGRYNPSMDTWTATSITNAPSARQDQTAAWTGSEMIIWAGFVSGLDFLNTGGRYDPGTDSWTATSTANAPSSRYDHTAVWTGGEMIVWGGDGDFGHLNTGGRYNPSTDTWTATSITNAPSPRGAHAGVWTSSEMIVWGGSENSGPSNTGGRYCAQPSTPIVQSAVSRKTHGNAGIFNIALPLNGTAGVECRTGGATNDYTLVITFNANVSVNGNPQAAVTSGVGIVGTSGMSNGGMVTIAGNVVTVPLTNVANVQTINATLFGVNGSTNVVIPMSILIGDTNANGTVNASDVSQTKSQAGQPVSGSNFREDVDANGSITAEDVAQVKSDVGTSLP